MLFATLVLGCDHRSPETRGGGFEQAATENTNGAHPARTDDGSQRNDNRSDVPNLLQSFAIAKGGDVVVLPVTLQGKDYLFVLEAAKVNRRNEWNNPLEQNAHQ